MKTILIIEDDPRIAAALAIRFKSQSYRTLQAPDAVIGFHKAKHDQPDLIILDISIPGGNGLDLARKFQQVSETKDIPLIFVTGNKDPQLRQKAMELNVCGLLEKPYDPTELLALSQFALTGQRSQPQPTTQRTETSTSSNSIPSNPVTENTTSMKKILIVEDDERISKALSLRLKSAGYETVQAHDALTGVSTAVQHQPDLMLLDISMPAGNGFLVAERLQTVLPKPVPTIFLTASKKPDFFDRAIKLGAVGYFEKPYSSEALLTSVQRALEEKQTCA